MRVLVLLAFEQKLGVVEKILAVGDGDFACSLGELIEVKLTVFAHPGDGATVRKECYQFLGLLGGGGSKFRGFSGVSRDQFGLDLILQGLALRSNVGLKEEQEEMRVQEGSQLLELL